MIKKVLSKVFGDPQSKTLKRLTKRVADINVLEPQFKDKPLKALKDKIQEHKRLVGEGKEEIDAILPEVFAIVRETARQVIGQRHFDVQLIGGMVLHEGSVAEMRTGEGKTLVATLAMVLNALSGKGAHLVTVNDYLAQRDAGWMGQIYSALGLTTGIVIGHSTFVYDPDYLNEEHSDPRFHHLRPAKRKEAYEADITYGTNNEIGFDYLRDNMVRETSQLRQRGLHFAIVDEVDSILIDEARTPLIISAPSLQSGSNYSRFAHLVRQLKPEHYEVDEKRNSTALTDEGVVKMQELLGIDNLYAPDYVSYIYHLEQSLRAQLLYKRDKHYVVTDDGEVIIVDEFTGRLMHGRRFNEGLHQAIEAKEGVEVKQESMTLATISFQNLFRLYDKLSGMTGTAETESEEFYQIYELSVIIIPTNRPMVRDDLTDRIYKTQVAKYRAVVEKVKELQAKGQPVLLGTASIEKNELLSTLLTRAGIEHSVLNAKNNEKEATIIAQAGQQRTVTLATNIAGRGTDIVLGEGVVERGGLFVLGSERHESRRIDNQLRGRTGRQGDPGTTQFFVAADDELMRIFGGDRIANLMGRLGVDENTPIENRALSKALESAQKKVESFHFDSRKHVVQYDDVMNRHRKATYNLRRKLLISDDIHEQILEAIGSLGQRQVLQPGESKIKAADELGRLFNLNAVQQKKMAGAGSLAEGFATALDLKLKEQEKIFNPKVFRQVEREVYLQVLDSLWMQHLENMDHLREGINWRQVGQRDPLVEYRRESQKLFDVMQATMQGEVVRGLMHAVPVSQEETEDAAVETELTKAARLSIAGQKQDGDNKDKQEKVKITRRVEPTKDKDPREIARRKRKQERKNRRRNRR